jgi:Mg/Co/Ni transporter MgtE
MILKIHKQQITTITIGGVEGLDFIKREDGTQSDPANLLPIEQQVSSLVGLVHGAIAVAFIAVYLGIGNLQVIIIIIIIFFLSFLIIQFK